MQRKKVKLSYIVFISAIFLFLLCSCNRGHYRLLTKNNTLKYSYCKTVDIMADTTFSITSNYFNQPNDFRVVINILFDSTKLLPYWQCDFIGCNYPSITSNKSLYRIDLIRLSKFYNCPNTNFLIKKTYGTFSTADLFLISSYNKFLSDKNVDTTIFFNN